MMEFNNPLYFLLLLLIIPYIIWYILNHRKTTPSLKISSAAAFLKVKPTWRIRLMHVPFLLTIVAYVAMVCALARPQTANSWSNTSIEGIDIMLCMDVSTSMLAEDLKPNRVRAARNVAIQFINGRENDNIGLTVFAGEAYTQCPMTMDHTALLNLINGLDCNMVTSGMLEDGTAIGMGVANAITRLKDSKAKSKVIILLTDGTNNRGDISPGMAAEIAKSLGIRVYTVAVGTNGTAPYPMTVGGRKEYVNVPVEIDTKVLSQIAEKTEARAYRATNTDKLFEIYEEIDKLEKTKMNVRKYSKRYEAYQVFALVSFLSLAFSMALKVTVLRRLP